MMHFDDDDIEVLGQSEHGRIHYCRMPSDQEHDYTMLVNKPAPRRRRGALVGAVTGIAVVIVGVCLVVLFSGRDTMPAPVRVTSEAVFEKRSESLPREFADSINDVAFTVVMIDGHAASVAFGKPDAGDASVVFATAAADYRADNNEIVGEFIHDGKVLSRGSRKTGYCYVSPEGVITIGDGEGDVCRRAALERGGTFFRQYALVMDGEQQLNSLKGKSKRRALAFIDNKPAVVISHDRESIYDFSQALADYGFSHALYLPGGGGFLKIHTDRRDEVIDNHYPAPETVNYLIVRK